MCLDHLDRYIWEIEAHANELLEYYSLEERERMLSILQTGDRELWLFDLCQDPAKEVFVFLGEDPSARNRRLAKMSSQEQKVLFVQARYHALQAARAMRFAASVVNVKGWKYRTAARHAAEAAYQAPVPPTLWDIMLLELPD